MFGSQVLETVIGLVTMFLVLALAASAMVELTGQIFKKRANDLEKTLDAMIQGREKRRRTAMTAPRSHAAQRPVANTTAFQAAGAASGRKRPSYLSASEFTDIVGEIIEKVDDAATGIAARRTGAMRQWEQIPEGLRNRLELLARQPIADAEERMLAIQAGLERWFDESMERLEGSYKRWARWVLLAFGMVLAIGANASTFHVADRLWSDVPTRQAVVNASARLSEDSKPEDLTTVAKTTDELDALSVPVGWGEQSQDAWKPAGWKDWTDANLWFGPEGRPQRIGMLAGWLTTALLVSLGAPFWFDVLGKLSSLRAAGGKPDPAPKDPTSASARLAAAPPTLGGSLASAQERLDSIAHLFGLQLPPTAPPPGAGGSTREAATTPAPT